MREQMLDEDPAILKPSSNQAIFCNTSNQGGVTTPSLDFPNRTPYYIDFGINR